VLLKPEVGSRHLTLHVAPEAPIAKWLKKISRDYVSIDLREMAMLRTDLTALSPPDSSRTLIWCSHVLEHIREDHKAMSEMDRVLRIGGTAIVQVPTWREATYENASVVSRQGRLRAFMQEDHVRLYGLDIVQRLRSAGFEVEVRRVTKVPATTVQRQSLSFHSTNELFVCRKPD
jgi:predicted SAM-dependent methyltransferase